MVSLFGIGEVPISISSYPHQKEVLLHTIRAVGSVTEGMQKLKKGDVIGVRGPFGTSWPMEKKDCDVLVIGGGVALPPLRTALYQLGRQKVALPPLRTALYQISEQKDEYKKMTFLYGTRTPDDILFKKDMECWSQQGIDVQVSVDRGDADWKGHVGVVTSLIGKHVYNPKNTLVFVCGPEIMNYYAIKELLKARVDEKNIYVSMERNMQCGTGFCGHCQYGPYFMCKDGPIFSYPQIKKWLEIKEL